MGAGWSSQAPPKTRDETNSLCGAFVSDGMNDEIIVRPTFPHLPDHPLTLHHVHALIIGSEWKPHLQVVVLGVPRAPVMVRIDLAPRRYPRDQHPAELQIATECPANAVPDSENRRDSVNDGPPHGLMRPGEVIGPRQPRRIGVSAPHIRSLSMRRNPKTSLRPFIPDVRIGVQIVQQCLHRNPLCDQRESAHPRQFPIWAGGSENIRSTGQPSLSRCWIRCCGILNMSAHSAIDFCSPLTATNLLDRRFLAWAVRVAQVQLEGKYPAELSMRSSVSPAAYPCPSAHSQNGSGVFHSSQTVIPRPPYRW